MREHEYEIEEAVTNLNLNTDLNKKTKPHAIRRNLEDYLEKQALKRRLKEIFDEDFLLD